MLLPAMVAFGYRDGGGTGSSTPSSPSCSASCSGSPTAIRKGTPGPKEGFLIGCCSGWCWGVGAVPFIISDVPNMSVSEAFFESFSGLTTTGATVLTGLDNLPKAFLFYRQLLQWLGGMGIIVLAVAVLPLLGIGACSSIAPDPGARQGQQGDPRIAETAKGALVHLSVADLPSVLSRTGWRG